MTQPMLLLLANVQKLKRFDILTSCSPAAESACGAALLQRRPAAAGVIRCFTLAAWQRLADHLQNHSNAMSG